MAPPHRPPPGGSRASGRAGHRPAAKRALLWVLPLTGSFAVIEAIGGLLTGSLALLADAGHLLSDNLAIGLALLAIWLAERPPTANRSFGYQRAEILAALVNGVVLIAISGWILLEATRRLGDPPEIVGGGMLAVAIAALAVNGAALTILWRARGETLNVAAAFRHLLADLLSSLGVIGAALVILLTGWLHADPLISIGIAALILASAVPILRDAVRVLLEAAPRGIDAAEVGRAMASSEGVVEVHDLHIWEVTSGFPALAAHVLVGADDDCHARRRELERVIADRFGITHTTIQVDHAQPSLLQVETGDDPE